MILRRGLLAPLRGSITFGSLSARTIHTPSSRLFSTSPSHSQKNRIYDNIRDVPTFETLLLLSTSSRQTLITLWTASWCPTCQTVSPLLRSILEEEKPGENANGNTNINGPSVAFAEIEIDSPMIGDLPFRYQVRTTPTLLAFSRGEAMMETVLRGRECGDRERVRGWVEEEGRRLGRGGGGGGGGLLGGLGKFLGGGGG